MRRLFDRIRWSLFGDRDLDEEIRAHIEIEAARLAAEEGLTPADARAAARRHFGSVALAKEDSRAVWAFASLETWLQDVRFALRLVARGPLFSLVAVGSLALGIGASIAAFALLDAVLAQPLPVADPHQLVLLRWTSGQHGELLAESVNGWLDVDEDGRWTSTSFSHPAYEQFRASQSSFTDSRGVRGHPGSPGRLGPRFGHQHRPVRLGQLLPRAGRYSRLPAACSAPPTTAVTPRRWR